MVTSHSAPHAKYERLIARAKQVNPARTVVVYPCDDTSLRGAAEAAEAGIIVPILVGPAAKIRAVAKEFRLDISHYEVVDVGQSEEAAAKAVGMICEAKGELLMKGSLHTDELNAGRYCIGHRLANCAADQSRLHNGCSHVFRDAVHHRCCYKYFP